MSKVYTGSNATRNLRLSSSAVTSVAASARVAFGLLVRDGAKYLSGNLDSIVRLGQHFLEFRVFYVENDSVDATRFILANLSAAFPRRFYGVMLDHVSATNSVAMCPLTIEGRNCRPRVELLAKLRQRLLELVLTWTQWHAFVMLDADFLSLPHDDYLQMFALGVARNATSIFGKSVYRNKYGYMAMYDTSALWGHGAVIPAIRAGCLTTVISAFSGVGTYFADALRGAIREARPVPKYRIRNILNEHARFNYALNREYGVRHGRYAYIDPRFRPQFHFWEGGYPGTAKAAGRGATGRPERAATGRRKYTG